MRTQLNDAIRVGDSLIIAVALDSGYALSAAVAHVTALGLRQYVPRSRIRYATA